MTARTGDTATPTGAATGTTTGTTTGTATGPAVRRPTVLHVVEALGGGVMVAVRDYVHTTGHLVHHVVLANHRPGHDTGDLGTDEVLRLGRMSEGHRPVIALREALARVRPDVVHLHSSWAGVIGRSVPAGGARIVYTPHCYAFERLDIPPAMRRAYRAAERVLARRTPVVAAVSLREAALAMRLNPRTTPVYVPNIARTEGMERVPAGPGPVTVIGVGRIMAQKDPHWFAAFASALAGLAPEVRVRWCGDGDADGRRALEAAGVAVTGWLTRREVLREMAAAHIYVHSAAWEGEPLTVLEAAALGLPVVGRDIPALRSLGLSRLHRRPADAAAEVAGLARSGAGSGALAQAVLESVDVSRTHRVQDQRTALLTAWSVAAPDAFGHLPRVAAAEEHLVIDLREEQGQERRAEQWAQQWAGKAP